jgi:hypothetical protein
MPALVPPCRGFQQSLKRFSSGFVVKQEADFSRLLREARTGSSDLAREEAKCDNRRLKALPVMRGQTARTNNFI